MDAKAAAIGKRDVVFARAGEIGMDVDGAPDIADQDEGRASMLLGERVGIFHGLDLGRAHEILPMALRAAAEFSGARITLAPRDRLPAIRVAHAALLGFEHESIAPIQIDPRRRAATADASTHDRALEDVIVALMRGVRRVGFGQAQRPAQADQKKLVVRPLLSTLTALPQGNERFERVF
jgi:hypothetical protein